MTLPYCSDIVEYNSLTSLKRDVKEIDSISLVIVSENMYNGFYTTLNHSMKQFDTMCFLRCANRQTDIQTR